MIGTNYRYKKIPKNSKNVSLVDGYNPALKKCSWINEIIITKNFVPPVELVNNHNIKSMYIGDITDLKERTIYKSQIALFQLINFIDSVKPISYKWNEYFLMCDIFANIPEKIKYVNIPFYKNGLVRPCSLQSKFIANMENYTITFPSTIVTIRVVVNYNSDDITNIVKIFDNIPFFLEKIIFSVGIDEIDYDIMKRDTFIENLIKNMKIPFGCEIIIDKFVF